MRLPRPSALFVALALTLSPLTVAAPAQADTVVATQVTFKVDRKKDYYGENLGVHISGSVTAEDGSYPMGTAELQRLAVGTSVWKTVGEDTSPEVLYFPDETYSGNAYYRVVYSGSTVGASPDMVTYEPAMSAAIPVATARNLDVSFKPGTTRATFKASPFFSGKNFVLSKKVGKKWVKMKTVKADKRGVASYTFPAYTKKTYFRIEAPREKKFIASYYVVYTLRY